ncbi:hypothetical protein BJ165DRAFT_1409348 [Panaeolus papilionaceus]|nr:hypothetical protein BJ165DRAFT_1409348 [Panaeolus papilionaceus]
MPAMGPYKWVYDSVSSPQQSSLKTFVIVICDAPPSAGIGFYSNLSRTVQVFMATSSALLANRNSAASLTAYDGKVGAIIGKYVYTSPNESFIPHPLLGYRHVRVREDYRYGPDDHTLWPQPYSEQHPHLGTIPRRPQDPNKPLSAMWYDPVTTDFCPINNGSIDRFKKWSSLNPDDKPVKKFISTLERALHYTYVHLQALVASWHQIRFTFTELQRYYLEIVGCLDYLEVYKPHMDGVQSSQPPLANTIGVFTSKVRIVEEFMAAGLPVWYIREWTSQGFGNNVLSEVVPIHYFDTLVNQPHSAFLPLFSGEVFITSAEVVGLVHSFSRRWSCSADPFEDVPSSSSTPPSGNPTSSSTHEALSSRPSSPPPRKKAKTASNASSVSPSPAKPKNPPKFQCDKFLPLEGPMAPFSIPAWANALRNVDKKKPPILPHIKRGISYAFPDPGLFVAVETDARRQHLLEQYARIVSVWISKITTTPGALLSAQQWRDLLTIDFNNSVPDYQPQAGDSQAMEDHWKALRLLVPAAHRATQTFSSYRNRPFIVAGDRFESGALPPPSTIRKFLFELYELNFRKELLLLHRTAHPKCSNDAEKQVREFEVRSLFANMTYYLPSLDPPNSGLAADDIKSRLPSLLILAGLMNSWRGEKPAILGIGRQHSIEGITIQEAHQLEQAVASYYCQQFYNYFRRAALIPHCLYESSPASSS